VQVLEAPRRAVGDLHPLRPSQRRARRRVLHALLACARAVGSAILTFFSRQVFQRARLTTDHMPWHLRILIKV
jgi:hypothetical protein